MVSKDLKAERTKKQDKKIKPWDDNYVPNFTYRQAENTFRDNVPSYTKEMPR